MRDIWIKLGGHRIGSMDTPQPADQYVWEFPRHADPTPQSKPLNFPKDPERSKESLTSQTSSCVSGSKTTRKFSRFKPSPNQRSQKPSFVSSEMTVPLRVVEFRDTVGVPGLRKQIRSDSTVGGEFALHMTDLEFDPQHPLWSTSLPGINSEWRARSNL